MNDEELNEKQELFVKTSEELFLKIRTLIMDYPANVALTALATTAAMIVYGIMRNETLDAGVISAKVFAELFNESLHEMVSNDIAKIKTESVVH